jgi:hypothetical protein
MTKNWHGPTLTAVIKQNNKIENPSVIFFPSVLEWVRISHSKYMETQKTRRKIPKTSVSRRRPKNEA